jgi:tRNA threonylcarbamoyladenosine biosynthesis protein TsaB
VRILAIETTALTGSVALLEDDRLIAENTLPSDQRSARSLAPTIQQIVNEAAWDIASLGLIGVAQGPGSFTGLRVGITTAKALAYALKAEVLGVDTLQVLANQLDPPAAARIHAVFDAQRKQLFAATFRRGQIGLFVERLSETKVIDLAELVAALAPGDVVVGPIAGQLASTLPPGTMIAASEACVPRAATIGRLAWHDYQAGRRDGLWHLAPQYHRPSAAEEKAASRGSSVG